MRRQLLVLLLLLSALPAAAQDERRITSPDGQLEFRILIAQPEPGALFRLAYQIFYRGKRLIDTSFMGLNVHTQEPLLGENLGLTSSTAPKPSAGGDYNTMTVEYMQNGSLGLRINVEVRAANDGIAFRYLVPRASPVETMRLEDETTEFALPAAPANAAKPRLPLPVTVQQPGGPWVAITEVTAGAYPRAWLARMDDNIFVTRLEPRESDPNVVYETTTPLTGPWRVVLVGPDRERLLQAGILKAVGGK